MRGTRNQETRMTSALIRVAGAMVAAVLLVPGVVFAQPAQVGRIMGEVTAATGGGLPGAIVSLTSTERGFSRSISTNAEGQYVFPSVPIGRYAISVERARFSERHGCRKSRRNRQDQQCLVCARSGFGDRFDHRQWRRADCRPHQYGRRDPTARRGIRETFRSTAVIKAWRIWRQVCCWIRRPGRPAVSILTAPAGPTTSSCSTGST